MKIKPEQQQASTRACSLHVQGLFTSSSLLETLLPSLLIVSPPLLLLQSSGQLSLWLPVHDNSSPRKSVLPYVPKDNATRPHRMCTFCASVICVMSISHTKLRINSIMVGSVSLIFQCPTRCPPQETSAG